jgi:hypothetical protein
MAQLGSVLLLAVFLGVGNLVAQRLLPTKRRDGLGRKYLYMGLVLIVTAVVFFVCAALYSAVSGEKLW